MYSRIFRTSIVLAFIGFTTSACWINAPFEEFAFEAEVRNESDHAVLVKLLTSSETPNVSDSILIQPNSTETICYYTSTGFGGFLCAISGLEFRFENGKGYICIKGTNFVNASDSCFLNMKDPLAPMDNAEGNGTMFVITQEDFENAWEL